MIRFLLFTLLWTVITGHSLLCFFMIRLNQLIKCFLEETMTGVDEESVLQVLADQLLHIPDEIHVKHAVSLWTHIYDFDRERK